MFGYNRYKKRYGESYIVKNAKGNEKFFEMLYDEYFLRVYQYYIRHGIIGADCLDLTSQTFMTVVNKINEAPESDQFVFWVLRISHNHLYNYYRKNHALKQISHLGVDGVEKMEDYNMSPLSTVENKYLHDYVLNDCASLGKIEQIIFDMKYNEGLSNKEISQHIKKPQNSVSSTLSKIRSKLRIRMNKISS